MKNIPELQCIKKGKLFYTQKYFATWLLLNYQNLNVKREPWESLDEAKLSFKPYRYSILSLLNDEHRINGKFEFLLEYPEHKGYNRWLQTSNPLYENEVNKNGEQKAEGYEEIQISFPDNYWGGLVNSLSDKYVLLDGSTYIDYTFFSIGRLEIYGKYGLASFKNIETTISILWIRITSLPFFTCKKLMSLKHNILYIFIIIIQ